MCRAGIESVLGGAMLQPQVPHMMILRRKCRYALPMKPNLILRTQFDASQAQFVSRYDARSVPTTSVTNQAVGRCLRLRTADHAAHCHARDIYRQHSLRGAAAGARQCKCSPEQGGLNARQRADLDDDALHRAGAASQPLYRSTCARSAWQMDSSCTGGILTAHACPRMYGTVQTMGRCP